MYMAFGTGENPTRPGADDNGTWKCTATGKPAVQQRERAGNTMETPQTHRPSRP